MFRNRRTCALALAAVVLCGSSSAGAETLYVAAGGDLQGALNKAQPGDTIMLEADAEFVGNFVLPVKVGDGWVTVRTNTPDPLLPPAGVRIQPSHADLLARLRSPNTLAALRTAPGAHHWQLRYLEFPATQGGSGDIIQIGNGTQNTLAQVPHHIILDHVYVHGDPLVGQKRGIALNGAHVTIRDSYISECKGIGQDTQAIGGWNGPGPYTIENNYLEAAGENVMFGGADPAIPNLVADGITFRRNYLSRPMSWRDPVIATPQGLSAAPTPGGALPAGVYAYRVVARRAVQNTSAQSAASVEVTVTTAAPGAVTVRWQPVTGATEYRVYGRTAGAQNVYWTVTGTTLLDTGGAGASGTVPTSTATRWTVKNLFELKNARNVVVEDNIMENHWKESQKGYAILLTPRNSNGGCSWCVVEHVRLERNVIRNVAAGISVLGYDAGYSSKQTTDIVVRNNLFVGLSTTLGGNAWFMLIGDAPRDVVIEHNTIDGNGTALIYTWGGTSADPREIAGFQMSANAARHGTSGIHGDYFPYGNGILNGFYPGAIVAANYLAGASASRYPFGTLVTNDFQDQFVNSAAGDYTVRDGSLLRRAAPDGSDIGADFAAIAAATDGVEAGVPPGEGAPIPVPPSAGFGASCRLLDCTFTDATVAGTAAVASRSWAFGDTASASGVSTALHTFARSGSYTVTLTVTDVNGQASSAAEVVVVEAPNVPPTAAFTASCVDLTCAFADRSTDSDGVIAAWSWAIAGTTAFVAAPSYTFAGPGTYQVSLTVADDDGATSIVKVPVQVTGLVHAGYSGITRKWSNGSTQYWSADVTLRVHGRDERPVKGATVSATWSGAVVKTATCVTDSTGVCVVKSGTLSYRHASVTLNVTAIAATNRYEPTANHDAAGTVMTGVTWVRP